MEHERREGEDVREKKRNDRRGRRSSCEQEVARGGGLGVRRGKKREEGGASR